MTDTDEPAGIADVRGIAHVRLTVTDIHRSTAFYRHLFGSDPVLDMSDRVDEPGVREDPAQFFGGALFRVGSQIVGLRPAAKEGDRFDSTRVGLDHIGLDVASRDDLEHARERLTAAGIDHGEIIEIAGRGVVILSIQDPDDINLELCARVPSPRD